MRGIGAMDADESERVAAIKLRIERCFRQIETERMAGIPILNHAICVEVIGLQRFGEEWLCILLTPWFMNVMLLPDARDGGATHPAASPAAVGSKSTAAFPAGRFEMICGFEAAIGHYRMCSLFSPMHEFADHESALLAAEAALGALLEGTVEDHSDAGMEMIWRGERPTAPLSAEASGADASGSKGISTDVTGGADDGEPVTALSRRGLLLGRARTEDQSER